MLHFHVVCFDVFGRGSMNGIFVDDLCIVLDLTLTIDIDLSAIFMMMSLVHFMW